MLKSEAEHFVRRSIEETGAQFTEEQVQALAYMITKIAARMMEEAVASLRTTGGQGPKQHFYSD
jgi:hypothetical protein